MLRAIGLITVVAFVYYMAHDEAAYRPSAEARQTEQAKVRQNLGQINFPTLVAETGCTSTYSKSVEPTSSSRSTAIAGSPSPGRSRLSAAAGSC